MEERIYLGGYEVYRKRQGGVLQLERQTLHVMDDKQRIALVETKTIDDRTPTPDPRPLTRYQFGNHLGSASLELDDQAQIISYEEYTPYGSTSYQAVDKTREVPVSAIATRGKSGMRRVGCTTTGRDTTRRGWGGGPDQTLQVALFPLVRGTMAQH